MVIRWCEILDEVLMKESGWKLNPKTICQQKGHLLGLIQLIRSPTQEGLQLGITQN